MSNPFGDANNQNSEEILEGFLCPICREDLKSLYLLTQHFERSHAEEQDFLKSGFKDIFSKATRKLRQNLEKNVNIKSDTVEDYDQNNKGNRRTRMNVFNFMDSQEVGIERTHMEYFLAERNPLLERYASETNKLIIRLYKLLNEMPSDPVQRKQHERNTVTWLDGSSVKLCPNCARSFHIARRQHHCRLCGSIMCNDCSQFLNIHTALDLASLSMSTNASIIKLKEDTMHSQQSGIRMCRHCLWLLQTRQEMHETRSYSPPICEIFAEIQQLKKSVIGDIEMYLKITSSLYEGESIFTIADASDLRGKIGQIAERIDLRSKRIFNAPCAEGSRVASLQKAVRMSCIQFIKDKMLSLPPLPDEANIREIQERKRMETAQRIETERRSAMEAYERYGLGGSIQKEQPFIKSSSSTNEVNFRSLDNWTSHQESNTTVVHSDDDPLIEQINIIKGYIKQARQDMNYSAVQTLELNLRELQTEFYQRHVDTAKPNNVDTSSTNK